MGLGALILISQINSFSSVSQQFNSHHTQQYREIISEKIKKGL